MERVQKLLARAGVASRREGEKLILQGRVTVDGQRAELGSRADPDVQEVCVDGQPLVLRPEPTTLALNKPTGYVSTRHDPQGRPTVMSLVPAEWRRQLYPVGRLDLDAQGLLLLTDDGELAHALTHPSFEVPKVYQVQVSGAVASHTLAHLRKGVHLEDGVTAPAGARLLRAETDGTLLELTLHEGRKREIKRMCEAVGHPVQQLRRVSLGGLNLGDLPAGQWRRLTPAEVRQLRRRAGLPEETAR